MTKKDYITIASAIAAKVSQAAAGCGTLHRDMLEHELGVIRNVASALAVMLERGNPRFDRARFMDACGFLSQE